jgi:hypothetical protein
MPEQLFLLFAASQLSSLFYHNGIPPGDCNQLGVVIQRGGAATVTNHSVFSVALKALTQRTRSVSVTSVFNLFLATENTEKTSVAQPTLSRQTH